MPSGIQLLHNVFRFSNLELIISSFLLDAIETKNENICHNIIVLTFSFYFDC